MKYFLTFLIPFIFGCSENHSTLVHNELVEVSSSSQEAVRSSAIADTEHVASSKEIKYETIKGIGLMSIDFDSSTIVGVYNNKDDDVLFKEIIFYNDTKINSWSIKDLDKIKKDWFLPYRCDIDYSTLLFQYISDDDEWIEIVLNENTNQVGWVKVEENISILSWEVYLTDANACYPIDPIANPIRTKPDSLADAVFTKFHDCLNVKSVTGEWIKVETSKLLCEDNLNFHGYIRWRNGNQLLIEVLK